MFTESDLTSLIRREDRPAVSIFMPTHERGRDVRQDAIRFKNLLAEARAQLADKGLSESMLDDAAALVSDNSFWQHQSLGLALFIDDDVTRHFSVPLSFPERVNVGAQFHVTPLLPLLASGGTFYVLTVTVDDAKLFHASRFTLAEDEAAELPAHPLRGDVDSDYENPVQASPSSRPNVGRMNMPNAQVFGDSPAEFKKTQLLEYVTQVANTVEKHVASHPLPLVLVADKEIGGHLRSSAGLSKIVAGFVDTNPAALDRDSLRDAAFHEVEELLNGARAETLDAAAAAVGRADGSALTSAAEIARAATEGRIAVLLLGEHGTASAAAAQSASAVEQQSAEQPTWDLLDRAAVETLKTGGTVQVVAQTDLPGGSGAVALLRY